MMCVKLLLKKEIKAAQRYVHAAHAQIYFHAMALFSLTWEG